MINIDDRPNSGPYFFYKDELIFLDLGIEALRHRARIAEQRGHLILE